MLQRETPLYQQIATHFEAGIFDGRLPAGTRLPTTSELAKEFQVNAETVQAALSQLTRRGLVERRRGAGTFVRRGVAGRCVAIVFGHGNFARIDRAFYNVLFDRLTQRLSTAGWDYRHYISSDRPEADRAFHQLQKDVADGSLRAVIEFCSNPLIKKWVANDCPVPTPNSPQTIDEADMMEQALLHLLRLGRRNIAVIRNRMHFETDPTAPQRQAEEIIARSGLGPARVCVVSTDETQVSGHAETLRLLADTGGPPDAIASLCDSLTRGAIHAIMQQGLGIGREIALITHANKGIDLFCHLPLTRLMVDPDDFASRLLAEVEARIGGTVFSPELIKAVLVPGRSCGEPA